APPRSRCSGPAPRSHSASPPCRATRCWKFAKDGRSCARSCARACPNRGSQTDMDGKELRTLQAPIKARYQADPAAALVTLRARGAIGADGLTCKVDTGKALV